MTRIDWDKPLETDEPTPRPVTWASCGSYLTPIPPCSFGGRIEGTFISGIWTEDGKPWGPDAGLRPSIRNVRPVVTSDEALQRMEAFVRKLAATDSEAREIVALLPEPPVDPDLIEARRLVANAYHQSGPSYEMVMGGSRDTHEAVEMAQVGIKRGREMAGGESA